MTLLKFVLTHALGSQTEPLLMGEVEPIMQGGGSWLSTDIRMISVLGAISEPSLLKHDKPTSSPKAALLHLEQQAGRKGARKICPRWTSWFEKCGCESDIAKKKKKKGMPNNVLLVFIFYPSTGFETAWVEFNKSVLQFSWNIQNHFK